jgi:uncharacterized protein YkwD
MRNTLFIIGLLACSLNLSAQKLTEEEKKLYDLIMAYRKDLGLPKIPYSPSLTKVAQLHVRDVVENDPVSDECNLHSWSSNGPWTPCCYTDDHAQAAGMWSKPRELTPYKGNGYEIAYAVSGGGANAAEALLGWQRSSGHNDVIINRGIWKEKWNAIGIGIYKNFAVVWFGHEPDKN